MDQITVGISGINDVDNPGPGVGVARSLREDKELNLKIVGLAYDAMEPGVYMDWLFDKSYIMPYPSGDFQVFLDRLIYIKEHFGLDFVIPTLDSELPLYIKYEEELKKQGIQTFVPTYEQFKLRGKDHLTEIAESIHIDLPSTEIVTSYDELDKAIDKIGFPVMIKGAIYKAHRAYTRQEALSSYNAIVAQWGYPIIVQEVVSGDEMNVVAVGDGKGNSLGMVGLKKMWITELGKIWTGVTIRNEKMLRATQDFIRNYKWKGAFELECIVDGDAVYLIEINPRFPAWSYFATGVGINLPSNALRTALKLPMNPIPDYEAGKLFIRYTYELITDMTPFQKIITTGEY